MAPTIKLFRTTLDAGLKDVLNDPPQQPIGENETFINYGVDSLDMMNLLLFLEEELEIDLDVIERDDNLTPATFYEIISNEC